MTADEQTIDCRGQLCPKPLMQAKRAIGAMREGALVVIVDNAAARENITRAMVAEGHPVLAEEASGEWTLTITKSAACDVTEPAPSEPGDTRTAVLVMDQKLGRSDPDLGGILMKAFISTIPELPTPPDQIILMQGGVRLACEGSDCVAELKRLEEQGVTVLACGTCLDYFGLIDKLEAGRISNMAEIADSLMTADRTVSL